MRCGTVALLLLLAACGSRSEGVPEYIVGAWRTDAPRYAGRVFEIDENQLRFGSGSGAPQVYRIDVVERTESSGQIHFQIHYVDPDDGDITGTLSLLYFIRTANLHLRNDQTVTWKRVAPASPPEPPG